MRQTFPPPTATSEDLIRQNERLARMAANRWAMRTNQPFDELLAPAYDGLIVGCRTYDPTMLNPATGQPFALSTRVVSCINSEILHWFRDHGYSVKFPPKWKEVWGKVKRLAATDTPLEEIARQTGLKSAEEVREMLAAMVGCDRLDETHEAAASESLEVEAERLSPLQRLVREAWAGMLASDCGLLLTWWENQRRHAFPSGPIQQFHKRLKALLKGRTLRQYEQAALLTVAPSGPTRREYERQALMELFGVDEPVRVQRVRREVDGVQLAMV